MKILHTSDWHIGKLLHRKKRYEEFEQFLSWLADAIAAEQIDVLLVAGDIFDTTAPSNRATELYYQFLGRVARTSCRHIVITAGNHDSPSLLNAPRELLRFLNIYVVGSITENIDDEVFVLRDNQGNPELIVCAVPYLRDSDVRRSDEGESPDEKTNKTLDGIRRHYAEAAAQAEALRVQEGKEIPIVAMGHLFAAGGETIEGDGVRDLYVGTLAHVTADIFPASIDYVALGHLHKPQMMNRDVTRRYSGSPLQMGFGEADQQKHVVIVETANGRQVVRTLDVPCFQRLKQLRGDWKSISTQLKALTNSGLPYWLEIVYDGTDIVGSLQEHIDAAVRETPHTVLAAIDMRRTQSIVAGFDGALSLEELTVEDIFRRCLDTKNVPEASRDTLMSTFLEAVHGLQNGDHNAE